MDYQSIPESHNVNTYGKLRIIHSPKLHVFGLWEDFEFPDETRRARGEHTNSGSDPRWDLNWRLLAGHKSVNHYTTNAASYLVSDAIIQEFKTSKEKIASGETINDLQIVQNQGRGLLYLH